MTVLRLVTPALLLEKSAWNLERLSGRSVFHPSPFALCVGRSKSRESAIQRETCGLSSKVSIRTCVASRRTCISLSLGMNLLIFDLEFRLTPAFPAWSPYLRRIIR